MSALLIATILILNVYERESVNRSQMDIKRKTCDIRTLKKYLFLDMSDIDTLVPSLYQCVETSSIEIIWLLSTSSSSAKHLPASCEPLYVTNTSHRKQETFMNIFVWSFLPTKKTHNRTLLFGSIPLKHGLHFDYWNRPLNMYMRVWYLDCHEAGLCCYLVIHIENLLRPLQLFYFHL
jgi:hypothetical protein